MTDAQLQEHFGISVRALQRLRLTGRFPKRDDLVGKTDSKAVDHFFDLRAGLYEGGVAFATVDGEENFGEKPRIP